MKRIRYYYLAAFFLLIFMNHSVSAAGSNCSYSKSVQQKGTVFDVVSRPAVGCSVQIVTLTVRGGGRKIAGMKADVDYLAYSAQAADLTGDGRPELVLISRTSGGAGTEALDVYWIDGTTLRRSTVPKLEDKNGYRGGDRFRLEGRLIIRTIPVYQDGDPAGKPTGGTRSLKYDFKDGALTPSSQAENAVIQSDVSAVQIVPTPAQPPLVEAKAKHPVPAAALAITWISVADAGIEIRTNKTDVKYKTILLNKPERIAIDIPGADSFLVGKKVAINRFGISALRVGRRKGSLRIVMDMNNRTFESFKVKSSGNSVFIKFIQ